MDSEGKNRYQYVDGITEEQLYICMDSIHNPSCMYGCADSIPNPRRKCIESIEGETKQVVLQNKKVRKKQQNYYIDIDLHHT